MSSIRLFLISAPVILIASCGPSERELAAERESAASTFASLVWVQEPMTSAPEVRDTLREYQHRITSGEMSLQAAHYAFSSFVAGWKQREPEAVAAILRSKQESDADLAARRQVRKDHVYCTAGATNDAVRERVPRDQAVARATLECAHLDVDLFDAAAAARYRW